MPITIGSNIASLKAQRQMASASSQLSTVFERLSSGQRINRASDDAAGLSVASALSVKSRIYGQAIRNINDGVSAISIADQAIGSLSDIVIRIKELAEQSVNGTYSTTQRQALDGEAQALSQEYSRLISTTSFNGLRLLASGQQQIAIETGEGNSQAPLNVGVTGGIGELRAAVPGTALTFDGGTAKVQTTNTILSGTGDFTISAWIKRSTAGTVDYIAGNYAVADQTGVEFYLNNDRLRVYIGAAVSGNTALQTDTWYHSAVSRQSGNISLYLNGNLDGSGTLAGNIATTANFAIGNGPDYTSEAFGGSIDEVRVYTRALSASEVATLAAGGDLSVSSLVGQWKFDEGSGTVAIDSSGNGYNGSFVGAPVYSTNVPTNLTLSNFSLTTQYGAQTAMNLMDSTLTNLTQYRGQLGAQQSRLHSELANISAAKINYDSAHGQIVNADVAFESAGLVRTQLIQQAASSILAQANQQPALALSLLQV